MAVFQQVRKEVERQPGGALLTLEDFPVPPEQLGAVVKSLSRLQQQGTLRRLIKGLYYKPSYGILGENTVPPYESVLAKLLSLYKDKISYVTGTNTFAEMGLTTQIANEYVIASDRPRTPAKVGPTIVRFIKSHVQEPVTDFSLVQLLDAVWQIREIPATTPAKASRVLLGLLRQLTPAQRQELARYARCYPPQTRAVTGLLLETMGEAALAADLKATLNPLTTYRLTLDQTVFRTSRSWNIL